MGIIDSLARPEIVGPIFGTMMIFGIVAVVFWFKAREKELQVHQEMRIREMEHQRKMKELDLEIEKSKERQASQRIA